MRYLGEIVTSGKKKKKNHIWRCRGTRQIFNKLLYHVAFVFFTIMILCQRADVGRKVQPQYFARYPQFALLKFDCLQLNLRTAI